jgi:hypothetical protein
MALVNMSLLKYREFYETFGQYRIDRVTDSVTYRGWASFDALTSDPVWLIQREVITGTETAISYVGDGEQGNIWDNRSDLFPNPPWVNLFMTKFDGINDFVNIGDAFNMDRFNPWTISFWYRPRVVNTVQTIFSKRNSSSVGIEVKMLANGRMDVTLMNAGANSIRVQLTTSLLPSTLYNITVTYEGNSLASGVKIYLNSTLQAASVVADNLTLSILNTESLKLGQFSGANYLDGDLDEVSLWDKSLNSSEISEIFNLSNPANLAEHSAYSNLIHWWGMGDSYAYPIIPDRKGNKNGTMTNMSELSIRPV